MRAGNDEAHLRRAEGVSEGMSEDIGVRLRWDVRNGWSHVRGNERTRNNGQAGSLSSSRRTQQRTCSGKVGVYSASKESDAKRVGKKSKDSQGIAQPLRDSDTTNTWKVQKAGGSGHG